MAEEQAFETRAEHAATHGSTSGGNPVTDFVRNSPFLFLSLLFHVIVLGLLAFITAREPEPVQRRITIKMEEMETQEIEPQPLQEEVNLSEAATSSAISGRGSVAEGESHAEAAESAESVAVDKVDIMGAQTAVSAGTASQFEGEGGTGFKLAAGTGRGGGVSGAVDKFAVATINAVATGRTLAVLLIDRSRSVIYGDLPRLIERMDHYFNEIDKNLPVELTGRGQWQVVSYGREPQFKGKPSSNLDYVQKALESVQVGQSGKENVGAAVEMVLDRFGKAGYKNILIAAMTDESGDDIQNPVLLQRLINRMRQQSAHFYVFGYESVFCARKKRVRLKLDPENMRGEDRNAIRGFEGRTIWGWADGGPESPRPELWWGQNWYRWAHWGATLNSLPSGFGMYALNRMVLATGGTYFLLKKESDYDQQKLYAKYKPDICTKFTYDERMKNIPLRRALGQVWREMGTFYLRYDLRTQQQVSNSLKRARQGRDYCIQRAKQLNNMINNSKAEGHNWSRWMAHAELTRAELLRLRFMLGQYYAKLAQSRDNFGGNLRQREKRIIVHRGKVPDDYAGATEAKKEYDLARQYIELVKEKHKGTPWAVLAERMQRNLFPWKTTLRDYPQPGPPQPPSLSF